MSWSSPRTWATGETLSGTTNTSGLNVQLRDNLISARGLWDNAVHLSLSANISIANNAYTAITWNVLDWQIGNSTIWQAASGTKLMVPVAGRYDLSGSQEWTANASGYRGSAWRMNGTTTYHTDAVQTDLATYGPLTDVGDVCNMTTADYAEVMAFQNSGAALNLHGGTPDRTRVGWRFIGAAS